MTKINDLIYDFERHFSEYEQAEIGIKAWEKSIENAPYPDNVAFAERQLNREKLIKETAMMQVEKIYNSIGVELKLMGIISQNSVL